MNDWWYIVGNYVYFVLRVLFMIGMYSLRWELGENLVWVGMFEGIVRVVLFYFLL